MGLYPDLSKLEFSVLKQRFLEDDPDSNDYDAEHGVFFEELARSLIKHGEEGYVFLMQAIATADFPRLRGILAALPSDTKHLEENTKLLKDHLDDERPLIIAEAIAGLRQLDDDSAYDKIMGLYTHASPYVRSSVLRYLAQIRGASTVSLLISALSDADFIVRESAADELGELGATEAIPALNKLLNDPHDDVRAAAATALEYLE